MDGTGRTVQRNVGTTVTDVTGLLVAVRLVVSRAGKGTFVKKVGVFICYNNECRQLVSSFLCPCN